VSTPVRGPVEDRRVGERFAAAGPVPDGRVQVVELRVPFQCGSAVLVRREAHAEVVEQERAAEHERTAGASRTSDAGVAM
jgi:hypothetical protein